MSSPTASLSPTQRTTVTRGRNRAVGDRSALHAFLGDALLAHVGVVHGSHPVVLPTAYGIDLDGPDLDGTLYLHASVAAGWGRAAVGSTVCVTVTELDGLVAARSGFHHSMNYRSAVVIGTARLVTDVEERSRALDLVVDQMVPGRSATLRAATKKELAATMVLALPLHEASLKVRTGGPVDDPEDIATGTWAGHIPLRRWYDEPVTDADTTAPVPADVLDLLAESAPLPTLGP